MKYMNKVVGFSKLSALSLNRLKGVLNKEFVKTAKSITMYRGMGEPYADEIKTKGLKPGFYVSADPAVGKHYGETGAQNILEHNTFGETNKSIRGKRQRLVSKGLTNSEIEHLKFRSTKPSGIVLKIKTDTSNLAGGAMTHLSEGTVLNTIPSKDIEITHKGIQPWDMKAPSRFDQAGNLTPKQYRVALVKAKVNPREVAKVLKTPIKKWIMPGPNSKVDFRVEDRLKLKQLKNIKAPLKLLIW